MNQRRRRGQYWVRKDGKGSDVVGALTPKSEVKKPMALSWATPKQLVGQEVYDNGQ
jgi:hypothetical protein